MDSVTLTDENFSSRDYWRNLRGFEAAATPLPLPPLSEWHPAFGHLSDETRAALTSTFSFREIRRLQFATYLARNYYLNEGI